MVVILASSAAYLERENAVPKLGMEVAMRIDRGSACVLPTLQAHSVTGDEMTHNFSGDRALIILAANKNYPGPAIIEDNKSKTP